MTHPVLVAVDGNSLLHRSYHARAHTGYRLDDGRPAWAVQGLLTQVAAAAGRACAAYLVVGFDDPDASLRRERWPSYKAHRPAKLATLTAQVRLAAEALTELGVAVVIPPRLEADDVLASAAAYGRACGLATVLVSSDRDCYALVDEHTRLLRVLDGGLGGSPMLDPARLERLLGVRPDQYPDLAALRGDPSDNLPGVRGIGPATAVRLLSEFGTAEALFADLEEGGQRVRRVVGPALAARLALPSSLAAWAHNLEVMRMHRDVDLGLGPGLELPATPGRPGRLPLQAVAVRQVYGRFDLAVETAVRGLCSELPGRPRPRDHDPDWQPQRPRSSARFPPLRRPRAAHLQQRLF
ncbi:MAG: hypothetical protein IPI32_02160 [Austwickia sp.]|jgi:5'-3' exonuclease|nr:hypothetical protein [Austwickia sp.]MBK8437761.1 hypothetical protein [Austwickia sp.]MBK9100069.1 hypothetical protein [Austwickia sp.]